jgi:hypothetical protein
MWWAKLLFARDAFSVMTIEKIATTRIADIVGPVAYVRWIGTAVMTFALVLWMSAPVRGVGASRWMPADYWSSVLVALATWYIGSALFLLPALPHVRRSIGRTRA